MSETEEHHKMMDEVLWQHLDKFVAENTSKTPLKNNIWINWKIMKSNLTQEQKLDYVFNYVKHRKRIESTKIIFKLLLLVLIITWIFMWMKTSTDVSSTYKTKIMPVLSKQLWELIAPLVWDVTSTVVWNLNSQTNTPINNISKTLNTNNSNIQTVDLSKLTQWQKKILERMLNSK